MQGLDEETKTRRKEIIATLKVPEAMQQRTNELATQALDEVMSDESFWSDCKEMLEQSEPMRSIEVKGKCVPFDAGNATHANLQQRQKKIAGSVIKAYCGKLKLPEVELVQEDVGNPQQMASFDKDKRKMFVFWNSKILRPENVVEAVTHELTHYYQRHLADQCEDGKIDAEHEDYDVARTLSINFVNGMYIRDDEGDWSAYAKQPVEAHAMATGAAANKYLMDKRRQRQRQKKS